MRLWQHVSWPPCPSVGLQLKIFFFRRCSSRNIGKWYSVNNRFFVENEARPNNVCFAFTFKISPQPAKTFWKWTSFSRNSTLKSSKNNCLTRWVIITGSSVKSNVGSVGSKSNEHCGINKGLLDVIWQNLHASGLNSSPSTPPDYRSMSNC